MTTARTAVVWPSGTTKARLASRAAELGPELVQVVEPPGGGIFPTDDAVAALRVGEIQLLGGNRRPGAHRIEQLQPRRGQLLRMMLDNHAEPTRLQPHQRAQRINAHG